MKGGRDRKMRGGEFLNCRFFVEENFTTTQGVFKHLALIFKSTSTQIDMSHYETVFTLKTMPFSKYHTKLIMAELFLQLLFNTAAFQSFLFSLLPSCRQLSFCFKFLDYN